jgi:hypothetical protein
MQALAELAGVEEEEVLQHYQQNIDRRGFRPLSSESAQAQSGQQLALWDAA